MFSKEFKKKLKFEFFLFQLKDYFLDFKQSLALKKRLFQLKDYLFEVRRMGQKLEILV